MPSRCWLQSALTSSSGSPASPLLESQLQEDQDIPTFYLFFVPESIYQHRSQRYKLLKKRLQNILIVDFYLFKPSLSAFQGLFKTFSSLK